MRRNLRSEFPASALAAGLLAVVLILRATLVAAEPSFPIDTFRLVEVSSIESLPPDVKTLLGRQKTGTEGIADKFGKFNKTDLVDERLPMRRFIAGGAGPSSVLVAYEHGGFVYSIQAIAFGLDSTGWVKRGEWVLHEKPLSLHRLLELVDSNRYARPAGRVGTSRRDGPLRELNVSDVEVREIQSAAREVYPGAIVNISGVVVGCPCEEGAGCTDQVWIVADRGHRSQGLQLSRVDGHWGIGVVQQWWLDFAQARALWATSREAYFKAMQTLDDSWPVCANTAGSPQTPSTSQPHP